MPTLTESILRDARSRNGGWSCEQMALLGIDWPLKRGWKRKVVGKMFMANILDEFVRLKDVHLYHEEEDGDELRSQSR